MNSYVLKCTSSIHESNSLSYELYSNFFKLLISCVRFYLSWLVRSTLVFVMRVFSKRLYDWRLKTSLVVVSVSLKMHQGKYHIQPENGGLSNTRATKWVKMGQTFKKPLPGIGTTRSLSPGLYASVNNHGMGYSPVYRMKGPSTASISGVALTGSGLQRERA